jgi:hypothetical protein
MTMDDTTPDGKLRSGDTSHDKLRTLSPEAERALAEAAERRARAAEVAASRPKELNGRDGPDPARYGDWESRGIASDF